MSKLTKAIWIAAVLFGTCGIAAATWQTHDWTVQINGQTYGLVELYDLPNQRTTFVSYGGTADLIVRLPIYAVALILVSITSIPPSLIVYLYVRSRRLQNAPLSR